MSAIQAPLYERSVQYVKGVGPQRKNLLSLMGIANLEDLFYYTPRRYEDRTDLLKIRDLEAGHVVTIRGRVLARGLRRIRGGRTILEVAVGDGSGVLTALWFNQGYLAQQFKVDEEWIFYGRVERRTRLQMVHPEIERVDEEEDSVHTGRIVPIYPLVGGVNQRWFRQLIARVLETEIDGASDVLPEQLRKAHGWPFIAEDFRQLHFPDSWPQLEQARTRLAFEELFVLQVALAQRRAKSMSAEKPQRYQAEGNLVNGLRKALPFSLTDSQQQVLTQLVDDLLKPYPMRRLLQGDVGCGKTIVMVFLVAIAVQSGYQVALMAPTELLAEQHTRTLALLLGRLGVSVGLLSQGVAPDERRKLEENIAAGETAVVVGTHALIQESIAFKKLAMVLIDEQHKFGVGQRASLAKKGQLPDVLVVTATPIPRTLALTLYGDLEVATITQMPALRRPIQTQWLRENQRQKAYAMIRNELALGRQVYIVYPLVNEGQTTAELKAATQMARHLQSQIFADFRVGLLHGQMKPALKEETMRSFAQGAIQLLVSTVIVEVGLDVPNATVMVIEHPERFGLAQLHQLRGRIGRGSHSATCLVISDAEDENVRKRLTAFVETSDGFRLAEHDLEHRGPGQLLGRQQHGWLQLRIADLARDRELLELARQEAAAVVELDSDLVAPAVSALRQRLARLRPKKQG